ncbi:unnamed protein product [Gadus morhua 'NCC']
MGTTVRCLLSVGGSCRWDPSTISGIPIHHPCPAHLEHATLPPQHAWGVLRQPLHPPLSSIASNGIMSSRPLQSLLLTDGYWEGWDLCVSAATALFLPPPAPVTGVGLERSPVLRCPGEGRGCEQRQRCLRGQAFNNDYKLEQAAGATGCSCGPAGL